jgi:hypothetical protein
MPTVYVQMTDESALQAARERLRSESYWSPSRALGHENRLILRVDYQPGHPADDAIREVDHQAHRVPTPQAEQRTARPRTEPGLAQQIVTTPPNNLR